VHPGVNLKETLFEQEKSIILTGTTLSTGGKFDYLKSRLGLSDSTLAVMNNTIDYREKAMIHLPSDVPERGVSKYRQVIEKTLISVGKTMKGHSLFLFPSLAAMRAFKVTMQKALEEDEILVLTQGDDGFARKVLTAYARNSRTVLLATNSFWEGITGEVTLPPVVMIIHLPFYIHTDPVHAARSQTFIDPFSDYALPQAALNLKTGLSKLIQSAEGRCSLVVLDNRLQSSRYNQVILKSLPKCQMNGAALLNLPQVINNWIMDGKIAGEKLKS
jgi:Rad3-related DNA helicase